MPAFSARRAATRTYASRVVAARARPRQQWGDTLEKDATASPSKARLNTDAAAHLDEASAPPHKTAPPSVAATPRVLALALGVADSKARTFCAAA